MNRVTLVKSRLSGESLYQYLLWFHAKLHSHIPQLSRRLNLLILYTGALQIENSEESDQGKYECVAMNSAGTRYSSPANLYVRGNVKIIQIVFMSVSSDISVLISRPYSISVISSEGLCVFIFPFHSFCLWDFVLNISSADDFIAGSLDVQTNSFGICLKLKNHFLDWEYVAMLAFFKDQLQKTHEIILADYPPMWAN